MYKKPSAVIMQNMCTLTHNLNGYEAEDLLALLVADAAVERCGHVLARALGGMERAFLDGGEQKAGSGLFWGHGGAKPAEQGGRGQREG